MERPFTVSVPLMNVRFQRQGKERLVEHLKTLGAKRVFLALQADCLLEPKRGEELAVLPENVAYLKAAGFEVGAWLWAFYLSKERGYTRMEAPDGKRAVYTVCPMDEAYTADMGRLIQDIARCGVDLIQFDDDYRYGFQDMGFGCACPLHRKRIEALLGREVTAAELKDQLYGGGPGDLRDAFVQANGEALETFAAEMRRYLDEVAPHVRMGFCACITSWDLDGTTPDRISRLLAGNTRPFYRLIGAPYWAAMKAWGNRLCDVIELERSESARREDASIEMYSEGDTFPRPRHKTPAAYLEIFDTALRAAGCTDGILKYALDYGATADYETGYVAAAKRNAAAYEAVERMFGGLDCAGVRCYDKPDKYRTFDIPAHIVGTEKAQDLAFSATSRFLAANSVPTVYEGAGVIGAAFGDDALCVPQEALARGMILDASAAKRLTERGVDVGAAAFGEIVKIDAETYAADGERIAIPNAARAVTLTLADGAEVLSCYEKEDGTKTPLSYEYENADGQRFLVYAFEGYFGEQDWFRQYTRQRQIDAFAKRCGRRLPAFCPGHPELYVLAKTDGERLAVGLWNIFPDRMLSPTVYLDREYGRVEAFGCEAKLCGDRVTLTDIAPYDFVFLSLR
ncbi:MAG: hypothetical protein IJK89_07910 [Clostridia bacterium]|nr:hypothetical protein [Clostridia bacterium]